MSSPVPTERLDALFTPWHTQDSPGCAVAILRDDDIVYRRGFGMANLEHGIPITPDTVFLVGSIAKQFTAFCILLLEDQHLLSVDAAVREYVTELPDCYSPVTLQHLIHHTSGIRDFWALTGLVDGHLEGVYNEYDMLACLQRQQALDFAPGERFGYSNSGYLLLATIIERVSGQALRRYADEHIFRPLGMGRTQFYDDQRLLVPDRADGYIPCPEGGYYRHMPHDSLAGNGGLLTTVEDLAHWDRNFYVGTVGGRDLLARMQLPGTLVNREPLPYAAGLGLGAYRGLKIVTHPGGRAGYTAQFLRFPGQHFSVVCLFNTRAADPVAIARRIADLCLADQLEPQPAWPMVIAPAVEDDDTTDPSTLVGTYWNAAQYSFRSVSLDGATLFHSDGNARRQLIPLGSGRFHLAETVFELSFAPVEPAGELALYVADTTTTGASSAGQAKLGATIFTRTPVSSGAPLTDYAGVYHSDELATTYALTVVEESLRLVQQHGRQFTLLPIDIDTFANNDLTALRFMRDSEGLVAGIDVSVPRARGIRFVRVLPDQTR